MLDNSSDERINNSVLFQTLLNANAFPLLKKFLINLFIVSSYARAIIFYREPLNIIAYKPTVLSQMIIAITVLSRILFAIILVDSF